MTRAVSALAALLFAGAAHAEPNAAQSCRISLSKFNALERGMNYAEARQLVGCAGKQFAHMENAGNEVTIYLWNGPGCEGCSGAYVTFANDSLAEKSQIGLER